MIIKIQSLKGKTKLNFYKNLSNYYDEMNIRRQNGNFQFEEDLSSKNAQGIGKIYHEVILLMKFLQTKPLVRKMNINCSDLFYTVIKKIDDNENINNKNEKIENNFIEINDFVTPNHYTGNERDNVM